MGVAGLVLAAGAGSRLGRPKALLQLGTERFVDRAVRVLAAGGADPVLVVVGAAEVGHVDALVVANPLWAQGMSTSLIAGLEAAQVYSDQVADLAAVVVLLVDQPKITSSAVRRVIDVGATGAPVAIATYGGDWGHPVLLARSTWAGVRATAQGDRGARPFLAASPALVTVVPCEDVGDPVDVDTPGDLAAFRVLPDVLEVLRR